MIGARRNKPKALAVPIVVMANANGSVIMKAESGTTYKVGYTPKSVGSSQGCQPTDARTILWCGQVCL